MVGVFILCSSKGWGWCCPWSRWPPIRWPCHRPSSRRPRRSYDEITQWSLPRMRRRQRRRRRRPFPVARAVAKRKRCITTPVAMATTTITSRTNPPPIHNTKPFPRSSICCWPSVARSPRWSEPLSGHWPQTSPTESHGPYLTQSHQVSVDNI